MSRKQQVGTEDQVDGPKGNWKGGTAGNQRERQRQVQEWVMKALQRATVHAALCLAQMLRPCSCLCHLARPSLPTRLPDVWPGPPQPHLARTAGCPWRDWAGCRRSPLPLEWSWPPAGWPSQLRPAPRLHPCQPPPGTQTAGGALQGSCVWVQQQAVAASLVALLSSTEMAQPAALGGALALAVQVGYVPARPPVSLADLRLLFNPLSKPLDLS